MYCFSNSFFVVKCVLVSLKVLDHLCLNTSLVQLKKILLAIVENLVTYIYIYIYIYILKMKILRISLEKMVKDEFNSVKHLILRISL